MRSPTSATRPGGTRPCPGLPRRDPWRGGGPWWTLPPPRHPRASRPRGQLPNSEEAAMGGNPENPYAGQGPVLLDIGGDVGALVVVMPADTDGLEVELRPAGATAHGTHPHTHGAAEPHTHGADGRHAGGDHPAYPHVAVVARPDGDGVAHTLVYPSVTE